MQVVYIAGASYSGSTLLGLIISAAPGVFYPGEIKLVARESAVILDNDVCTCGEHYARCPFWADALLVMDRSLFLREASWAQRAAVVRRLAFSRRLDADENGEDWVLERLLAFAEEFHGRPFDRVLDNSKGLWRLHRLAANPRIELKVIHVTRRLRDTATSYRKHEGSLIEGAVTAATHNGLIDRYLKRFGIAHIDVSFEELLDDERPVIQRINSFLGVSIPIDGYVDVIRGFPHHVLGGNPMRLRYGAHLNDFNGIERRG